MPAIANKKTATAKTARAAKPVTKKAPNKKVTPKTAAAKKSPARKAIAAKKAPVRTERSAADLRKAAKAKAQKVAALQAEHKPVKTVFNRSELMERLAAETDLSKRDVAKVYGALHDLMLGSLMPKAVGEFTLPGLMKIVTKKIAAKKGGQKIVSFGVERISKPKPATVRVRARLLAKVKQIALPAV